MADEDDFSVDDNWEINDDDEAHSDWLQQTPPAGPRGRQQQFQEMLRRVSNHALPDAKRIEASRVVASLIVLGRGYHVAATAAAIDSVLQESREHPKIVENMLSAVYNLVLDDARHMHLVVKEGTLLNNIMRYATGAGSADAQVTALKFLWENGMCCIKCKSRLRRCGAFGRITGLLDRNFMPLGLKNRILETLQAIATHPARTDRPVSTLFTNGDRRSYFIALMERILRDSNRALLLDVQVINLLREVCRGDEGVSKMVATRNSLVKRIIAAVESESDELSHAAIVLCGQLTYARESNGSELLKHGVLDSLVAAMPLLPNKALGDALWVVSNLCAVIDSSNSLAVLGHGGLIEIVARHCYDPDILVRYEAIYVVANLLNIHNCTVAAMVQQFAGHVIIDTIRGIHKEVDGTMAGALLAVLDMVRVKILERDQIFIEMARVLDLHAAIESRLAIVEDILANSGLSRSNEQYAQLKDLQAFIVNDWPELRKIYAD